MQRPGIESHKGTPWFHYIERDERKRAIVIPYRLETLHIDSETFSDTGAQKRPTWQLVGKGVHPVTMQT